MTRFDTIIIGGGVIGLSLARELHRHGAGRIAVIERGRPGRQASFAAAGMLAPNAECEKVDDFYRLCDQSRMMFPEFAGRLLEETGVDIELDRSGTLYAAFSDEDAAHLSSRHTNQIAAGIPVQRLSAGETLEAEPYLSGDIRGSLYFPNDWQVENRRLITALESYASSNGIELINETSADSLVVEGGIVKGAVAGGKRFSAAVTVLATGAWTSLIKVGVHELPFEVRPVRGQMISFQPPKHLFKRVVYSPRGYLVPRADGRVLIGATVEDAGFDDRVTPEALEGLQTVALEIAPSLKNEAVVDAWSGLRPFASDAMPILGAVDGFDGLYVATAHYRNGILLAPLTAQLVAALIVNGTGSEYFKLFGHGRKGLAGLEAVA